MKELYNCALINDGVTDEIKTIIPADSPQDAAQIFAHRCWWAAKYHTAKQRVSVTDPNGGTMEWDVTGTPKVYFHAEVYRVIPKSKDDNNVEH